MYSPRLFVFFVVFGSKVLAPHLGRDWANWMMWSLLKFSGKFEDGDTDKEDAEHGDGGVAFPVFRATVRATSHTPNLEPEIFMTAMTVICCTTSHC